MLNNGLSGQLKAAFPNIVPVLRPPVKDQRISDPHWITGFVDGEGNFDVRIQESKTYRIGYAVNIGFRIAQHSRDAELIKSIVQYFACGIFRESSSMSRSAEFFYCKQIIRHCRKYYSVLTPCSAHLQGADQGAEVFFDKYPLQGKKSLDYADFKRIADILRDKGHLTATGLDQIRKIKSGMNTGRD